MTSNTVYGGLLDSSGHIWALSNTNSHVADVVFSFELVEEMLNLKLMSIFWKNQFFVKQMFSKKEWTSFYAFGWLKKIN